MTAHDIVLYGATGFAGQLVAERLAAAERGEFMQFRVLAET